MCGHNWKIVNDVSVCLRCGLTINRLTGEPICFDRKLVNRKDRRSKRK